MSPFRLDEDVRHLDELDAESMIQQIDSALAGLTDEDESAAEAVAAGHRLLTDAADDW